MFEEVGLGEKIESVGEGDVVGVCSLLYDGIVVCVGSCPGKGGREGGREKGEGRSTLRITKRETSLKGEY